jgi:hypothetical protein
MSPPLWAFVADGRTSTVFGTPGLEADEIRQLRPRIVVASPELAERLGATNESPSTEALHGLTLLDAAPALRVFLKRWSAKAGESSPARSVSEILDFEGMPSQTHRGGRHDSDSRINHQGPRAGRVAGLSGYQRSNTG